MHMKRLTFAFVLAVGGAAACGDDAGAPVIPPVSFAMNAVNGNGVTGTARIEDQEGAGATVIVTLQGMPANTEHAGHVHTGACAAQGAILFGLSPITADAQGTGSATTTGVPDDVLVDGFYLQYHTALAPPGAPISCADIPAPPPAGGY
jgi:hypothetical protein